MDYNEDIDQYVLQELYDLIVDNYGDNWLSDYDEVDFMDMEDAVCNLGNEIDGYDDSLRRDYTYALLDKWKEEHQENDFDNDIEECLRNAGVKL